MNNLLVNSPTGKQELIEVSDSGGYFDAARVIWDERIDGAMPVITLGGMVRTGDALVFNQIRMDEHIAASKPPVPVQVTMRQARLALLGAGLLASVNTAIAGLSEPAKSAALIDWEYSAVVQRDSGLVPVMSAALGMTAAQIDALFVTAATL